MLSCRRCRGQQGGFTLLELLVVVLIIGLGIAMVSLSVGGKDSSQQLRTEARQLGSQLSLVMEEAVLSGYHWGVDFFRLIDEQGEQRYGYRWLSYTVEDGWLPEQPPGLPAETLLPPGIELLLWVDDEEKSIADKREITDREWKNLQVAKANYDKRTAAIGPAIDDNKSPLVPSLVLMFSRQATPMEISVRLLETASSDSVDGETFVEERLRVDLLGRIERVQGAEDSL